MERVWPKEYHASAPQVPTCVPATAADNYFASAGPLTRDLPAQPAPPPQVLRYALMSPAGSYTDWHCDFGGSSVWYHLISGRKARQR